MNRVERKWLGEIYSDGSTDYLSNPSPRKGEVIDIFLRTPNTSNLSSVHLWGSQKGEPFLRNSNLIHQGRDYYRWRARVKILGRILRYNFVIVFHGKTWIYNQAGIFERVPSSEHDFKIISDFECPSWVHGRSFYQIFTDRFFNGDSNLNPQNGSISSYGTKIRQMHWNAKPLEYEQGRCLDFFGGDLPGIQKKLNHLQDLGINALYLNPIFHAPSHHKYDCQDYFKVDPAFGGNQALENLMKECHGRDIKVILDISINHVGSSHRWFNREGIYGKGVGAYQNPEDHTQEYFVKSDSEFHKWAGVDELLTLNYASQSLREIMYRQQNSILKYWLGEPYGIDGWRFDVGHSTAREGEDHQYREVWQEIRHELKTLDSEKYLMAELWEDPEEYLQGDQWDACMNYHGFLRPVRTFLGEQDWFLRHVLGKKRELPGDAKTLNDGLQQIRTKLPFQIQNLQFNLLNSHDIHRFYNLKPFPFSKHRLAAILLFSYPGVPCIYYGDEVALAGHTKTNEGYRFPMNWEPKNQDLKVFDLYAMLCRLRLKSKALKGGGYQSLFINGGIFAFARFLEGECVISIVSNESEQRAIQINLRLLKPLISTQITEIFGRHKPIDGSKTIIKVEVPPNDGLIFSNLRKNTIDGFQSDILKGR